MKNVKKLWHREQMKNEAKEKKEVGTEHLLQCHHHSCLSCSSPVPLLQLFKKLLFFSNQAEDLLRREKNLEEAKKVVIKNDPSLPEPKCVSMILCRGRDCPG